jgi:hypothetical protein
LAQIINLIPVSRGEYENTRAGKTRH